MVTCKSYIRVAVLSFYALLLLGLFSSLDEKAMVVVYNNGCHNGQVAFTCALREKVKNLERQ